MLLWRAHRAGLAGGREGVCTADTRGAIQAGSASSTSYAGCWSSNTGIRAPGPYIFSLVLNALNHALRTHARPKRFLHTADQTQTVPCCKLACLDLQGHSAGRKERQVQLLQHLALCLLPRQLHPAGLGL